MDPYREIKLVSLPFTWSLFVIVSNRVSLNEKSRESLVFAGKRKDMQKA